MFRAPFMAIAAALCLIAAPAAAQTATLAAQRQAVFEQMLGDPANRDLMRQYAQLSVRMRDFEAAAATLERLIDLEPTNTAARVELAIAYFALGSYAVAEYHLQAAERSGALSPAQSEQVARYREEAQDRDDPSVLGGRLELGHAWPQTSGEVGAFLNAELDWRLDLGGPNATQWVTELGYSSFQPGQGSVDQRQNARIRTGPEFRFKGDAYGPRIQPYVQLDWISRDPILAAGVTTWSAGIAYQNPINERFTVYSDLSVGYGMPNQNMFAPDFRLHELDLGVTFRPSRDTRFRLSGWVEEREELDILFPLVTSTAGVRLSAQHAFDPDFSALPNRWVAGAFAETEESDISNVFTDTRIVEDSYGMWLRAFVYEDIYVEAAAAMIAQDQTNFGFTTTTEETVYSVQVGWEF